MLQVVKNIPKETKPHHPYGVACLPFRNPIYREKALESLGKGVIHEIRNLK